MRWVTKRINSGIPLLLTSELWLCCCEQRGHKDFTTLPILKTCNGLQPRGPHFDKVLEFFILLLKLLEDTDGVHVVTAEIAVHLLHCLGVFI